MTIVEDDYLEALHDEDLVDPTSPCGQCAAYRLVRAIGFCKIGGVPYDITKVTSIIAQAAMVELNKMLRHIIECCLKIESQENNPDEFDNLARGIISLRHDAWAVYCALENHLLDLLTRVSFQEFDELNDLLDEVDKSIEARQRLLAKGMFGHTMANKRADLRGIYREFQPWWLDGRFG